MRLIEADFLKDKIADLYTEGEEATEGDKVINNVIDIIDNAPTVEVTKPQSYVMGFCDGLKAQTYEKPPMFERSLGEWGKWIISEIRCPNCLEYFQTDCYSTEELKKCPCCGAQMRGGGANE